MVHQGKKHDVVLKKKNISLNMEIEMTFYESLSIKLEQEPEIIFNSKKNN